MKSTNEPLASTLKSINEELSSSRQNANLRDSSSCSPPRPDLRFLISGCTSLASQRPYDRLRPGGAMIEDSDEDLLLRIRIAT